MNKIRLAFSPCPNDTFIFDPIVNQRINLEGLTFDYTLHDVETLNKMAFEGKIHMLKVSFFTYVMLRKNLVLLDAGSALGFGNGPLLISRQGIRPEDIPSLKVAIPGEHTTAHLLFTIAAPQPAQKVFLNFADIEDAILNGTVDAGVIIHENRFTYRNKGLHLVMDLGAHYEKMTGQPVPLGGIVVKQNIGYDLINKLNRIMYRSVDFAMKNPEIPMEFVRSHASEMDPVVMKQHIGLYVSPNTLSLGTGGHVAITQMIRMAQQYHLVPPDE